MNEYRELLLGCGNSRAKLLGLPNTELVFKNLTTADCNAECNPDILINLNIVPWYTLDGTKKVVNRIVENSFDEVHAYEVLEHLGSQGDVRTFFDTFNEIYRVLKPDGHLFATTPSRYSAWLWGDPSHARVILQETLSFLCHDQIVKNRKARTAMSDFDMYRKCDFKVIASTDNHVSHIFCLQAQKPARPLT
jgi:predicted SAM-dependent methyltransferase